MSINSDVDPLEKHHLTLGFIPLTDSAPLIVAKHLGLYEKYGLDVTLSRETCWNDICDKVAHGKLDAAQMLATMPLTMSLGIGSAKIPTLTALVLGLNGNAVTLSESLYRRLEYLDARKGRYYPLPATLLKQLIDTEREAGLPPLTFATVSPNATQLYELRYWLASAGIDPLHDIRIKVVPPDQMVEQLTEGHVDGYSVCEPWNSMAIEQRVGRIAISGYDIWNNRPEKVLGVTEEWATRYPHTHRALLLALLEACRWLDMPVNRLSVATSLAQEIHAGVPESIVRQSLIGHLRTNASSHPLHIDDFHVFHRYAANFPWQSHALWYLDQMVRWGELDASFELRDIAARCFRSDLYRETAVTLGIMVPERNCKAEGIHFNSYLCSMQGNPLELGADRFCDGARYEVAPQASLPGLGTILSHSDL